MSFCFVVFLLVASQVACGGASWSLFPELELAEIPLGKYHVEKRQLQGIKVSNGLLCVWFYPRTCIHFAISFHYLLYFGFKKKFNLNFCGPFLAFSFNGSRPFFRKFCHRPLYLCLNEKKNHDLFWLISFVYSGNCCTRSSKWVSIITICFCGVMLAQWVPIPALI